RRRHTRSTRDWSSDVCSSDLRVDLQPGLVRGDAHDTAADVVAQFCAAIERETVIKPLRAKCAAAAEVEARSGDRNGRAHRDQLRSEERRVGKECGCRGEQEAE